MFSKKDSNFLKITKVLATALFVCILLYIGTVKVFEMNSQKPKADQTTEFVQEQIVKPVKEVVEETKQAIEPKPEKKSWKDKFKGWFKKEEKPPEPKKSISQRTGEWAGESVKDAAKGFFDGIKKKD